MRDDVTRPSRLLHEPMGTDISGATLGIVGLGRIGTAVAQRAHFGFGMKIVYQSRRPADGQRFATAQLADFRRSRPVADAAGLHRGIRHRPGA